MTEKRQPRTADAGRESIVGNPQGRPSKQAGPIDGRVTGEDDYTPKSARQKAKTTLVTRKTGTKKATPR